jgi:hypothetical protein
LTHRQTRKPSRHEQAGSDPKPSSSIIINIPAKIKTLYKKASHTPTQSSIRTAEENT